MAASTLLPRSKGLQQRCIYLVVSVVLFIGAFHFLVIAPDKSLFTSTQSHSVDRLQSATGRPEKLEQHGETPCQPGLEYLKNLGVSATIRYSRRCIKPMFPDGLDRDVVANITSPLIVNTTTINLDDRDACSTDVGRLACDPLELPVSKPDPKNQGQYGHLIFGVATTYNRMRDSRHTFASWLSNSGAAFVCIVSDDPEQLSGLDFSKLEAEYLDHGMKLKLVRPHDPAHAIEQSHLMIIEDMLAHAQAMGRPQQQQPHWLGILDDDTFFPSLHALSAALARHDHTTPQYLGQLTENAELLRIGVLGAFGGAGVFLSAALARDLRPHLDACRGGVGGDMQIMQCVHRHSRARLTRVEGLWQCDLVGDSAGFYESGRRMLSMHHWKSWNHLPAAEMGAVTGVCGDCFLARFVFPGGPDQHDGGGEEGGGGRGGGAGDAGGRGETAVLNNGYSINVYGAGVALPDLGRTEQTWDNWDRGEYAWADYEWSLGPLRERVRKDQKKSYHLATVVHGKDGELTQVYLRRGGDEGRHDEVVELVWQP